MLDETTVNKIKYSSSLLLLLLLLLLLPPLLNQVGTFLFSATLLFIAR